MNRIAGMTKPLSVADETGRAGTPHRLGAGIGSPQPEPSAQLSSGKSVVLRECEAVLERGLATFFEVGNALLRIRDDELYRATHATFKEYCQDRWNLGRAYAWRLIAAAERIRLLPLGTAAPRPVNEFQVRPFLKLAPEEFPAAWKQAGHGKITSRVLQAVVSDLLPHRGSGERQTGAPGRRRPSQKVPVGQVLALLQETRRRIANNEVEAALATLDPLGSRARTQVGNAEAPLTQLRSPGRTQAASFSKVLPLAPFRDRPELKVDIIVAKP
jgi:hypothetical protein